MADNPAAAQIATDAAAMASQDEAFGGSYFAATAVPLPERPALTHDLDVDICIIGGGLAGLTAAYEIARRGWAVAVLEARRVAWNASSRNTGFVLPGYGQDASTIVERVGLDHARELWALSQGGVDYVRQTIVENELPGIAPSDGWLHVSKTDRSREISDDADLLRSLGADIEFWPERLVRAKVKSERLFQAIHFPTALNIHPLNYAAGLARLAEEAGARIFEHTKALSIDPAGVRKRITTATGRVRAGRIIIAGNVHLDGLMPQLAETLLPVQTYVIVTKPLGEALPAAIDYPGSISDTDTADSHYRIVGGDRLMWCGRITVWDGNPRRYGRKLLRDMRRRFPQLAAAKVDYAWRGSLGLSVHRMPQIGEVSPGVWLTSGFGGHGLNTTAMAGNLMARTLLDGDDRWRLFEPFELVWAGGRAGRIVMQATYWGRRLTETWGSRTWGTGRAQTGEAEAVAAAPAVDHQHAAQVEAQQIAAQDGAMMVSDAPETVAPEDGQSRFAQRLRKWRDRR